MTTLRSAVVGFAVLLLGAGCADTSRTAQEPSPAGLEGGVEVSASQVGKRIRVVLKPGTQVLTGKLVDVRRHLDAATIETDYGSKIAFRPSQVAVLEEMPAPAEDHAGHQPLAAPDVNRFTLAPRAADGPGPVASRRARLVIVDFRHEHKVEACLLDLSKPLQESPSTVVFSDGASTLRLRVPLPDNERASLVPFSWHAHVLGGAKESPTDRLFSQNTDGEIAVELKEAKEARQLILVGTPHRIEKKMDGISALAPPRMVAIDLVDAGKAGGMLGANPSFVFSFETVLGKLYTASQSANDSEMILSTYDPDKANASTLGEVRYSVQDALLVPAWTLEATDAEGRLWQRVGAYPVPRFLSFDTPDTTRITLEVGDAKRGEFAAPAQVTVRSPETAIVKADLDIRYAGLLPGTAPKVIVAHGLPHDAKRKTLFNPVEKSPKAGERHESMEVDLSKAPVDAFPAQVFVWYQLTTPWNAKGGLLLGATPMREPATKKAPKRRVAVFPAPSPGLRFITFTGPKGGGESSAMIPAALGGRGLGGETIGSGGPYVPFSPTVGTAVIMDKTRTGSAAEGGSSSGSYGTLPVTTAYRSPQIIMMPRFAVIGGAGGAGGTGVGFGGAAGAGAVAVAICNSASASSGGCGGKEKPLPQPGPDTPTKPGGGGKKEPKKPEPKYPDTPTEHDTDKHGTHPLPGDLGSTQETTPLELDSTSGYDTGAVAQ